jgi:hypothetical protein
MLLIVIIVAEAKQQIQSSAQPLLTIRLDKFQQLGIRLVIAVFRSTNPFVDVIFPFADRLRTQLLVSTFDPTSRMDVHQ